MGPRAGHTHTHTVIFLHGRDSNSQEFAPEFFESEASGPTSKPRMLPNLFPTIRWVFPSAPVLHSERFDTTMSQWFDMWSVEEPDERRELQLQGLKQSITSLSEVIRDEGTLIPRQRIFLGGISQGFATALSTFFADGQGFAGLIGLCTWMPLADIVEGTTSLKHDELQLFSAVQDIYFGEQSRNSLILPALKFTPIFIGHSSDDEVVPVKNGRRLRDILLQHLQLAVQFYEYGDGGHWINEPQGVDDIVKFLATSMRLD